MLIVNFNENKPLSTTYTYSVQGNNKVDVVRFAIPMTLGQLELNGFAPYVCVESEDGTFVDKARISFVGEDSDNNIIFADWEMERKHTQNKSLFVSLCLEDLNANQVWNTQRFKLNILNGVLADEEIENKYPTILEDYERRLEALEQGGGGGGGESGPSELYIERVWLSYLDKKIIIKNIVGLATASGNIINDSTRIFVNFKSSPISSKMEDEIKAGKLVIRFDYPIKSKNIMGELGSITHYIKHTPSRDYGITCRSFLPTFNANIKEYKRSILLNSLIYINENDIKTNAYGEKYIHKQISLFDFTNHLCWIRENTDGLVYTMRPLTKDMVNNDEYWSQFFVEELDEKRVCGIPNDFRNVESGVLDEYNGASKSKSFSIGNGQLNYRSGYAPLNNTKKLNPAFSTYFLTVIDDDFGGVCYMQSPYFISQKNTYYFSKFNDNYILFKEQPTVEPGQKKMSRRAYMSAKPRFAIINDEDKRDVKLFIKKYAQSEQQIKLICRYMLDYGDSGTKVLPVFRTIITAK